MWTTPVEDNQAGSWWASKQNIEKHDEVINWPRNNPVVSIWFIINWTLFALALLWLCEPAGTAMHWFNRFSFIWDRWRDAGAWHYMCYTFIRPLWSDGSMIPSGLCCQYSDIVGRVEQRYCCIHPCRLCILECRLSEYFRCFSIKFPLQSWPDCFTFKCSKNTLCHPCSTDIGR